jgi:hypothetical protein
VGSKNILCVQKFIGEAIALGRDELPLVRTVATDSPIFHLGHTRTDEQELVPTESAYGSKVTLTDVSPEMTMSIPFW